jgi:hypothetical protein
MPPRRRIPKDTPAKLAVRMRPWRRVLRGPGAAARDRRGAG